ncbi:MAG: sugar ABC transporter substrate-binding protein [Rickettsiales bacterium]|nr:sugar ABC transporter substrate-binding protein [Rickettsiales bacterium]
MVRLVVAILATLVFALGSQGAAAAEALTLWHSYRGAEEQALNQVLEDFANSHPETPVIALAIPYEVMASKLTTTIPRGNGPDLFIFAHERIGGWAESGLVTALDPYLQAGELAEFLPQTIPPLRFKGSLYALPLAFKSTALFRNTQLVPEAPASTDELLSMASRLSAEGRFGLAYQSDSFYFHAPWFFGFGGALFRNDAPIEYGGRAFTRSLEFVAQLQQYKVIPSEPTGALISSLFNQGKAAMVVSGPWFLGEIEDQVEFAVSPLPRVSATGLPASPFLTDEAVFVSAFSERQSAAVQLARHLTGRQSAIVRGNIGRQIVAHAAAWEDPLLRDDAVLSAFRAQLATTVAMDNRPAMRDVWEPTQLALKKILRGKASASEAAAAGAARHRAITRPLPEPAAPQLYLLLATLAVLGSLGLLLRWGAEVVRRGETASALRSWSWAGPATLATAILVFLPFAVGLVLAFFAHRQGDWTFVGLANFIDILAARSYGPTQPMSFYFALGVTLLWTVLNVALHLGIGLALALILNRATLRLRPIYRVLLILPWAVPNYITALIWKGLFHKQFGAINGFLEWLGLDAVSWFSSFGTAFFANLCTNVWLGFPFMMVICMGALQSIPSDLYEAAEMDGAGWFDQLRHVTLPLLRPALIPAVLLGTVWTFNSFNIVYLVSGGEPDGATEILISEAYRWAFTRREQYGYAAAYAVLIFLILLGWSALSARIARHAEANS